MEEIDRLKKIIEEQTRMLMDKNRLLAQMESRLKETIVRGSRNEDLARFQLQLNKDALQGQTSLLKTILGSLPLGLVVVDSKGHVISYNAAAEEILDFAGERVMGKSFAELLGEESEMFSLLQDVIQRGEARETPQLRIALPQNREAVLALKTVPVLNDRGAVAGVVQIFSDITSTVVREDLLHAKNDNLVRILTAVMEKKDGYVMAHSERVKDLALKMAGKIGMSSPEDRRKIHYAALLHDIGLISVPDEILQGKETTSEKPDDLLQAHPVEGDWMLSQVDGFNDVRRMVRSHHERFDGRGYPDGLTGTDIPMGARIIGLVEAYDAMLHDKATERRTPERIFAELERNKGLQFDPQLVDVFLTEVVGDNG